MSTTKWCGRCKAHTLASDDVDVPVARRKTIANVAFCVVAFVMFVVCLLSSWSWIFNLYADYFDWVNK